MKKLLFLTFIVIAAIGWYFSPTSPGIRASAKARAVSTPVAMRSTAFAESAALAGVGNNTDIATNRAAAPRPEIFTPGISGTNDLRSTFLPGRADLPLAELGGLPPPEPLLSFDGIANLDNAAAFGLLILPPDMNGDVGPNHYVQIVNSLIRVYDKRGLPLTPPIKLSNLFAPLNTPCAERNDGLPNVLYDPLADRWLVSQVCSDFPPFKQLVGVSKTSDPSGQYFLYEFTMPNVKINDFPKFGVWSDGYYMSTDEFLGSDYVGSGMFAFDRTKMLAGDSSAGYIYFNRPESGASRRRGILPADIDGLRAPAAGAPALFASYSADEYGDAGDAINLFEFRADFGRPENSTFVERAESPIAVESFDPTSPNGRQDISQPPPGEFLDSVSDRLNFRLAYRNFGTYESLTVNQTVRVTPASSQYRAGVRIYELRNAAGAFSPAVQATIGDAMSSRWIGAVAQDNQGNIAVEYNRVSNEKQPSILYTGRLASDAANVFKPEQTLVAGTGVQKAFGWRWGEYSGMSVDPTDDCTFWMTNAYYTLESQNISDFTWLTRIGSFKFSECTAASRAFVIGTVTDSVTGQPISGALVTASAYTRSTDAGGSYGPMYLVPETYPVTAEARGYASETASIKAENGQTVTRNFSLRPVAVFSAAAVSISSESCRLNQRAEPGERVTLNISLQNIGAAAATDLTGEMLAGDGVSDPGAPQRFGAVAPQATVARPFDFTVSRSVACGATLPLRLRLTDAGAPLGDITLTLPTGETQFAFREAFDRSQASMLPRGWSTSSSPNHQVWRTSSARSVSPNTSLFSPAPVQQGINEVTTPAFRVTSPLAEVSFQNWYELETTFLRNRLYDGSVMEIKIGDSAWRDILAAGGTFLSGGYDGIIDGCCQNPLAGRLGWSGRSGNGQTSRFVLTRAKLPPSAVGQDVRLRFRIGSDIGGFREGQYIDDLTVSDGYSCSCGALSRRTRFDFDGDGKTDLSLFNLSGSVDVPDFRYRPSAGGAEQSVFWGTNGDEAAVADFDGDGKSDFSVFRPSDGTWYIINSSDGTMRTVRFGLSGDRPIPADFDGDGRADPAVFRPASGTWYILRSLDGGVVSRSFGLSADRPFSSDFDGDGMADLAVFRPSNGTWYTLSSASGSVSSTQFGLPDDRPAPGDFDGDGRDDFAVYRPSTGVWYLNRTTLGFSAVRFGLAEDLPLQADFDGDRRADVAIFRPSTKTWYIINSSSETVTATLFGSGSDRPVPGSYLMP